MSSQQPSKINADAKYYQGAAKEAMGQAIGNQQMQAEGKAKKLEGEGEYKAAQTKGQAEGYKDKVTGGLKETAGQLTGNQQMQAEGNVTKNTGQAQADLNKST
ncbi:putative cruciform DNA binding protein [Glomus cerebriforme]|uniref:Putative cruciform DNA binding protein n=1 Tax=Glomus cerebriforme TaxID=658196 RepID=A0A397TQ89_9GLOM|nr:putative cruciform DNA binding protein [Glomus cerebriforme]